MCGLIHVYQFGSFHIEKRLTLPLKWATAARTKSANSLRSGLKPLHLSSARFVFPHAKTGGSPVSANWTLMP